MTTYDPYPVVEIDGGIYLPDNTLDNIRITSGRDNVLDQPNAGYASVELWTDANTPIDVELSDSLRIAINKGTSGTQTIFTGTISDIQISMPQYGSIGSIVRYNITGVGSLALLNKRLAGTSGYSKEFDGTRIYNILYEAFVTEWDDLDSITTWNDLPNTVTWASYDATNEALVNDLATTIDTPGDYELTAYAADEANALTLAQNAAQSGRGVLWEHWDGGIHYDAYESRALATPLELTADDLLASGLSVDAQWGDLINNVTIVYKNGASKNAQDPQSEILYGQLAASKTTQLENGADAQEQANAYLESRAYPRIYPKVLTVPLHSPTVSDATRDELAAVYNGLRISTSALPPVFGGPFDGFVEGWTWELTKHTAFLAMNVSAYSETYLSQIWLQVPQTTTWSSYNPTTTWENA